MDARQRLQCNRGWNLIKNVTGFATSPSVAAAARGLMGRAGDTRALRSSADLLLRSS